MVRKAGILLAVLLGMFLLVASSQKISAEGEDCFQTNSCPTGEHCEQGSWVCVANEPSCEGMGCVAKCLCEGGDEWGCTQSCQTPQTPQPPVGPGCEIGATRCEAGTLWICGVGGWDPSQEPCGAAEPTGAVPPGQPPSVEPTQLPAQTLPVAQTTLNVVRGVQAFASGITNFAPVQTIINSNPFLYVPYKAAQNVADLVNTNIENLFGRTAGFQPPVPPPESMPVAPVAEKACSSGEMRAEAAVCAGKAVCVRGEVRCETAAADAIVSNFQKLQINTPEQLTTALVNVGCNNTRLGQEGGSYSRLCQQTHTEYVQAEVKAQLAMIEDNCVGKPGCLAEKTKSLYDGNIYDPATGQWVKNKELVLKAASAGCVNDQIVIDGKTYSCSSGEVSPEETIFPSTAKVGVSGSVPAEKLKPPTQADVGNLPTGLAVASLILPGNPIIGAIQAIWNLLPGQGSSPENIPPEQRVDDIISCDLQGNLVCLSKYNTSCSSINLTTGKISCGSIVVYAEEYKIKDTTCDSDYVSVCNQLTDGRTRCVVTGQGPKCVSGQQTITPNNRGKSDSEANIATNLWNAFLNITGGGLTLSSAPAAGTGCTEAQKKVCSPGVCVPDGDFGYSCDFSKPAPAAGAGCTEAQKKACSPGVCVPDGDFGYSCDFSKPAQAAGTVNPKFDKVIPSGPAKIAAGQRGVVVDMNLPPNLRDPDKIKAEIGEGGWVSFGVNSTPHNPNGIDYGRECKKLIEKGLKCNLIFTADAIPHPISGDGKFNMQPAYMNEMAELIASYAKMFKDYPDQVTFQLWNQPDVPTPWRDAIGVEPGKFGMMASKVSNAMEKVCASCRLLLGGFFSGQTSYLEEAMKSMDGKELAANMFPALNLYPQGSSPQERLNAALNTILNFRNKFGKEMYIPEFGLCSDNKGDVATVVEGIYALVANGDNKIKSASQYAWSDKMDKSACKDGFGITNDNGVPYPEISAAYHKPEYSASPILKAASWGASSVGTGQAPTGRVPVAMAGYHTGENLFIGQNFSNFMRGSLARIRKDSGLALGQALPVTLNVHNELIQNEAELKALLSEAYQNNIRLNLVLNTISLAEITDSKKDLAGHLNAVISDLSKDPKFAIYNKSNVRIAVGNEINNQISGHNSYMSGEGQKYMKGLYDFAQKCPACQLLLPSVSTNRGATNANGKTLLDEAKQTIDGIVAQIKARGGTLPNNIVGFDFHTYNDDPGIALGLNSGDNWLTALSLWTSAATNYGLDPSNFNSLKYYLTEVGSGDSSGVQPSQHAAQVQQMLADISKQYPSLADATLFYRPTLSGQPVDPSSLNLKYSPISGEGGASYGSRSSGGVLLLAGNLGSSVDNLGGQWTNINIAMNSAGKSMSQAREILGLGGKVIFTVGFEAIDGNVKLGERTTSPSCRNVPKGSFLCDFYYSDMANDPDYQGYLKYLASDFKDYGSNVSFQIWDDSVPNKTGPTSSTAGLGPGDWKALIAKSYNTVKAVCPNCQVGIPVIPDAMDPYNSYRRNMDMKEGKDVVLPGGILTFTPASTFGSGAQRTGAAPGGQSSQPGQVSQTSQTSQVVQTVASWASTLMSALNVPLATTLNLALQLLSSGNL